MCYWGGIVISTIPHTGFHIIWRGITEWIWIIIGECGCMPHNNLHVHVGSLRLLLVASVMILKKVLHIQKPQWFNSCLILWELWGWGQGIPGCPPWCMKLWHVLATLLAVISVKMTIILDISAHNYYIIMNLKC